MSLQANSLALTVFLTGFLYLCCQFWSNGQVIVLNRNNSIELVFPADENMFSGIYAIQRGRHLTSKVSYCQLCHIVNNLITDAKIILFFESTKYFVYNFVYTTIIGKIFILLSQNIFISLHLK